ncbi:MAG: DUF2975 domain-containing protein [Draconibacterium sp.]
MKVIRKERVFRGTYYFIKFLFFLHLLYILVNLILNYSIPFDKKSEVTIRGYVSVIEKDWQPMEVKTLNSKCEPIFLLHKSGFIRFDFNSWKDALDKNSVLNILFYNLWLLMGLFISFQLYTIFRTLYKKATFDTRNTLKLRWIASTIIVMPFVKYLAQYFFTLFARSNFQLEGHSVHLVQNNSFFQFPYLPYLVVGMLVFAITEIYNEGMCLQSETNLTI